MVTTLCLDAGVPTYPTDTQVGTQPLITVRVIDQYNTEAPAQAAPQQFGDSGGEDTEDEDAMQNMPTGPPQPIAGIDPYLQYVAQQNDYIIQQNQHLMGYYQQLNQYGTDYTACINNLFGRWDLNQDAPVIFPPPPLFPPFQHQPPQPPLQD